MKPHYTTTDITEIKDGRKVLLNRYWVCRNGSPTEAVLSWGRIPQCHESHKIAERMLKNMRERFPNETFEVVFIPTAFVAIPQTPEYVPI